MAWLSFIHRVLNSKNQEENSVSNFIRQEKRLYEERFGQVAVAVIMQRSLMFLMSTVLLSAAIKYYRFTGDLRYPLILLPMVIWAFFHHITNPLFSRRFLVLKLYVLICFYLMANVLMQLWVLPYGEVLVDNSQFVMISLLGIMLASFIATSPYASLTLLINLPILALYNTAMGWIAEERGLNILRQNIQGMALGGAISFVMMTIYRYRVYFTVQERMLKERAELIARASEQMSKIFHSIDQAVFYVIEQQGELIIAGEGRSPQCRVILDLPFGGEPVPFATFFLKNVALDEDQKSSFKSTILTILGGKELDFELNEEHFPREIVFFGQANRLHLSMTYAPIMEGDTVKGILFTALDNTVLVQTRATNRANETRMGRLMNLLALGRERGEADLTALENLTNRALGSYEALCQFQSNPAEQQAIANDLFIPLHTIKGNARTLNLKDMASICHEAEEELEVFRKSNSIGKQQYDQKMQDLRLKLLALKDLVQDYKDESKLLGWQRHNEVIISRECFRQAFRFEGWDQVRRAIGDGKDDQGYLESFLSPEYKRCSRFPLLLQAAAQRAASLAHKPCPDLLYTGSEVWLKSEAMNRLLMVLPHLLANAIDHGIESQEERRAKSKSEKGIVNFQMSIDERLIRLKIGDDGRGVNPDILLDLALSRGLLKVQEGLKLSDLEKVALILADGFSSKSVASELSGRGVGLSALRGEVEAMGGGFSIDLGERQRNGFCTLAFEIRLPIDLAWL